MDVALSNFTTRIKFLGMQWVATSETEIWILRYKTETYPASQPKSLLKVFFLFGSLRKRFCIISSLETNAGPCGGLLQLRSNTGSRITKRRSSSPRKRSTHFQNFFILYESLWWLPHNFITGIKFRSFWLSAEAETELWVPYYQAVVSLTVPPQLSFKMYWLS